MKVGEVYYNQDGENLGYINSIFEGGKYILTVKEITTTPPFDHWALRQLSDVGELLMVVGSPEAWRLSSFLARRLHGKFDVLGIKDSPILTGYFGKFLDFCELVIELNDEWLEEQSLAALKAVGVEVG